MILGCDLLLVFFFGHEVIEVLAFVDLDFDHPAGTVWIIRDGGRVFGELFIDFGDFSVDGRIEFAHGLHGFDLAKAVAVEHVVADVRQVNVDDVREVFDGEGGDADGTDVAFQVSPFVGLAVT